MHFVQFSSHYKTVFHSVGFHVNSLRKQLYNRRDWIYRDWSITKLFSQRGYMKTYTIKYGFVVERKLNKMHVFGTSLNFPAHLKFKNSPSRKNTRVGHCLKVET